MIISILCKTCSPDVRHAALTAVSQITLLHHNGQSDFQINGFVAHLLAMANKELSKEDAYCIFGTIMVLSTSNVEVNDSIATADNLLATLMNACTVNSNTNKIPQLCIALLSNIIEASGNNCHVMDKVVADPTIFISFVMALADSSRSAVNIYALQFLAILAWYNDQAAVVMFGSPLVMSRLTTLATTSYSSIDDMLRNAAVLCLQVIQRKAIQDIQEEVGDENLSASVEELIKVKEEKSVALPTQQEIDEIKANEVHIHFKEESQQLSATYNTDLATTVIFPAESQEPSSVPSTTENNDHTIVAGDHGH